MTATKQHGNTLQAKQKKDKTTCKKQNTNEQQSQQYMYIKYNEIMPEILKQKRKNRNTNWFEYFSEFHRFFFFFAKLTNTQGYP